MPATITVTSLADEVAPNDGKVSLREAIIAIDNNGSTDDPDIIRQSRGAFGVNDRIVFQTGLTGTIQLDRSMGQGAQLPISKPMTIQGLGAASTCAASNTCIDAQGNSRIFDITATAGDVTLDGLTLTNGRTTGSNNPTGPGNPPDFTNDGGAIHCLSNGTLTIRNSIVSGNQTTGVRAGGGAIFMDGGALTIINSQFSGNNTTEHTPLAGDKTTADTSRGGAIYSLGGAVTVTGSTFSGNFTQGYDGGPNGIGAGANGGAIFSANGSVTITNSTLSGNYTDGANSRGGAIFVRHDIPALPTPTVTLTNSTLSDNFTKGTGSAGGGIYARQDTTVLVDDSTLSGNYTDGPLPAKAPGGGIFADAGAVTVTNSTIADNHTKGPRSYGGGIYALTGAVTVTNSTIANNSTEGANSRGGGLFWATGALTVNNSTISGNSAALTGGGLYADSGQLTANSSIIAGNSDSGGSPDLYVLTLNASLSDSLIGNAGMTGLPTSLTPDADGNLIGPATNPIDPMLGPLQDNGGPTLTMALLPGSPAIDRGTNGLDLTTDQRGPGFTRVSGARADMGAFEVQPPGLALVVTSAEDRLDSPPFDPSNLTLRDALVEANANPTFNTITIAPALSGMPIKLSLGQLEISNSVTIQGLGAADTTIDAQGNSRIFLIDQANPGDVTLDGLTLTGGKGQDVTLPDGQHTGPHGGAIESFAASGSTLTVQNCVLSGNSTTVDSARGGAIWTGVGNDLVLTDSTVSGNSTHGFQSHGGGIYASDAVTVTNSTVSGNYTTGDNAEGGGIAGGAVTVTGSTVSGNHTDGSGGSGGGIEAAAVTLIDSTVSGNATHDSRADGGGIWSFAGTVTLTNSTLAGNTAQASYGGGLSDLGTVTLTSSIVAGNHDSGHNPDLEVNIAQLPTVVNSLIGDKTGTGLAATGNGLTPGTNGNFIGSGATPIDPLLGPLKDNGGPTQTMALSPLSPAVTHGSNPIPLATDQRGLPRVVGGKTDMGAFELQAPSLHGLLFDSAASFAAGGGNPDFVAAGDFNGDGKPDLAVANLTDNTVSVLLGNGDSTFQAPHAFAVGAEPVSVAVADLTGDGKTDLVVVNQESNTVSVLLGNGDGTFQPQQTFAVGASPRSVAVGDFNGDGIPDLAVVNSTDDTVSVLLGNGDGSFRPQKTFAVGSTPDFVVAADFNGDGKLDLAVSNVNGSTVSVLLGKGDGTFQPQQTFAVGFGDHALAVGDLNGDGKPDLAVANSADNTVSVLLGNGDGTFQKQQTVAVGDGPTAVAVGDFNGDGKLDLAVTNDGDGLTATSFDTVSVLLGNGDGTFRPQQTFATGVTPFSVAVADLNSDGKADLAVVNIRDGTVSALLGNGDGTFQAPRAFATGFDPSAVAVGDFNGDGKPDLAVANYHSNTVGVLLGNGDGTFQPQQAFAVGNAPQSVAVADFNGDGKPDLVVANLGSNSVSVLLGNGDGTFGLQQSFAVGVHPSYVAVGDFNHDGIPDLAVANSMDNTVSVLLGKGDGTFRGQRVYAVGNAPQSVAVADFNGDGKPDLAVANLDGTVSILLGNSDGTFQPQHTVAVGVDPIAVAVGDFNGDGKADLAVAGTGGGDNTVSVLLANGDGTFQAPHTFGGGGTPTALAVADFNGDGKADLAVTYADAGDNVVRVYLGNGDGTFQAAQSFAMAHDPQSLAVADWNGDGKPDLAVANLASNNVGVLLNEGAGTTTTVVTSKANPTSVGDSTTFTALVTGAKGGPAPTGTVTFQDGVRILAADVPLSNGEADFTTTDLSAGAHTITATYSGDDNYAGSSGTVVQQVHPASSSTALTQSGAPTEVGQPVTFTATVGGAGPTPTGTVTFRDGATVLADGVALDGSGVATFRTTALAGGTHAITAAYSGDSNHGGSSSPAVTVQINPTSATMTVATSGSPSVVGQPVTLTVTVGGPGPTPTGTVTFQDGEVVLATGIPLDKSGVARFATTALAVGTHGITAAYGGDSNHAGGTSAVVTQTVLPLPPPPPPGPTPPPAPEGVVLVTQGHGKTKRLVAVVEYTDGRRRGFSAPFQRTRYRSIRLALADLNGDGVFDAVVFTARDARSGKKVRRVFLL